MKQQNQKLLRSLLEDSSFSNWVRKSNKNDVLFWKKWISENPEEIATIEAAKSIILGVSFKKSELSKEKINTALENVLEKIASPDQHKVKPITTNSRRSFWKYGIAASLIILLGLATFLNQSNQVIHKTEFGEIIKLTLPDGTLVTLNGNSEISYDKNNSRDVTLKGEAYFKVKPIRSTKAKFWVNTEDLRVEVYGTQFHVNTREEKTNVLLDEGAIKLLLKNGIATEMAPGELVSFSKEEDKVIHNKVSKDLTYSLWREGTYIFNNTSLKEVIEYVSHAYGLSSEFIDLELEQKTITGGIPNQNLKICLSAIEKSTGTRIVMRDKKLLIINNEN